MVVGAGAQVELFRWRRSLQLYCLSLPRPLHSMLHSFGTQVLKASFILLLVEVVIGEQGFGNVSRVLGRCSQSLIAPRGFTHYLGCRATQFLMLAPEFPLRIPVLLETALLLIKINYF